MLQDVIARGGYALIIAIYASFFFFRHALPSALQDMFVDATIITRESYDVRNSIAVFHYKGVKHETSVYPWSALWKYGKTYAFGTKVPLVVTKLHDGRLIAFRFCTFMTFFGIIALGALVRLTMLVFG